MNIRKFLWAIFALAIQLSICAQAFAQETVRAAGQPLTASVLNSTIQVILSGQQSAAAFNVQGLTASGATLTIEASTDATAPSNSSKVWVAVAGYALTGGSGTGFTTLTTDQSFRVDVAGFTDLRLRVSSTGTGTITVGYNAIPTGIIRGAEYGPVNVTPVNCSGTIGTGGTAQIAIAANANLHGFTIANIDAASGSGEPLWYSLTTTALAGAVASYPLSAPTVTSFAGLASFTTPYGFGSNAAVSVVAATTGHKFACTYW